MISGYAQLANAKSQDIRGQAVWREQGTPSTFHGSHAKHTHTHARAHTHTHTHTHARTQHTHTQYTLTHTCTELAK